MFLLEDITRLALWLLFTIVAVNLFFLSFVFYRRLARKRYYTVKDAARDRYQHVINKVLAGKIGTGHAASLLAEASAQPEHDALEEMLLSATADQRPRTTELLFGLGYVERWARAAFGYRRGRTLIQRAFRGDPPLRKGPAGAWNPMMRMKILSVSRALAVEHLGTLTPAIATYFATEALADPATDVQRTAIAILGRNRESSAIPLLVQQLAQAVQDPTDISLRTIKTSLVAYQIDDLLHFLPSLAHPAPRVRFFLVDAIAQICQRAARQMPLNKNDFPRAFYEIFLEVVVNDTFADVRARSAGVIRHFRDGRATDALRKLLHDENEFVRLHAARACAGRSYLRLTPDLAGLLGDARWRVREAAAQSLRAFGHEGVRELFQQFVSSTDRYASEQITDEIQRAGIIEDIAASLVPGQPDFALADAVCRKMVSMQKTSLLMNAMASTGVPAEARAMIMDALVVAAPPQFYAVIKAIADTDGGPLGSKATSLLGSGIMPSQTASGTTKTASGKTKKVSGKIKSVSGKSEKAGGEFA